jgi:hypothetical protein
LCQKNQFDLAREAPAWPPPRAWSITLNGRLNTFCPPVRDEKNGGFAPDHGGRKGIRQNIGKIAAELTTF